jgi:hypothetical protein
MQCRIIHNHAQYIFVMQVANAPPGLQACSFDIEAFHRTCPVIPDHKPWLVVQGTKDDFYIDHTHPFGASSASSNAGMIGNAIIDIWVSEGIGPIAKYEDDVSVYRTPVPEGPFVDGGFCYAYDKEDAASRISSLGIPWHKEKGDPCFLSAHVYIGFFWDLANHTVSLPLEKRLKFAERVRVFLLHHERKKCPLREVDKIHGSLCHVSFVYTEGRSHLPSLSNFAASFKGDERICRYPPKSMISDLKWWLKVLSDKPTFVHTLHPIGPLQDLGIYVDASTSWGIGILIGGRWAAFRLLDDWKIPGRDICWLESLAIEFTFYFLEAMQYSHVNLLIHSDSQGAIGAFGKGRCPNWHINLAVRRSFPILARTSIHSSFTYIESASNPADPISRGILPHADCKIDTHISIPDELAPLFHYV